MRKLHTVPPPAQRRRAWTVGGSPDRSTTGQGPHIILRGIACAVLAPARKVQPPLESAPGVYSSVPLDKQLGQRSAWANCMRETNAHGSARQVMRWRRTGVTRFRGLSGDELVRRVQWFDSRGSDAATLAAWLRRSRVRCSGAAF